MAFHAASITNLENKLFLTLSNFQRQSQRTFHPLNAEMEQFQIEILIL